MSDCKEIWDTVSNFSGLQNAMILYLEGKCTKNLWMLGSIEEETIPIVESLIKINRKGFVTIEGQPGTITQSIIRYAGDEKIGELGEKYTEIQRGYMDGLILNKKLNKFVKNLVKTDKVIVYTEDLGAKIKIHGTIEDDMRNPENYNSISLTQEKGSIRTNYYTNFKIHNLDGVSVLNIAGEKNKKLKKFLERNCTYVFIVMKKQGDTSLDKIVLSCL